ncbi:MAG: nitronate monooxygenase [Myxococcales bacterium]|nr:nitronate monooxygenase [Myxococcales bacterium]
MVGDRIRQRLGIRHPIVQGGMIWNAGARLAAAVSEAGGLGLIGSGSMDPDTLRLHVRKARTLTAAPFGVNVPLTHRHAAANLDVALQEGVRIFFTSAGSPAPYLPRLRQAGAVVFHVVSTPDLARKCEALGVDGIVAEGFEAGGHDGRDELTTLVLVPQVVAAVRVPVLAAGGIATGAQMAAALVLGADGVQVGTRFAATTEGSGHEAFKRAIVEAGATATHLVLKKLIPVRLIDNAFRRRVLEAEARGASADELRELLGRGRARRGMFEGDLEEGELEAGQSAGLVREIRPAAEVVAELVEECEAALRRVTQHE